MKTSQKEEISKSLLDMISCVIEISSMHRIIVKIIIFADQDSSVSPHLRFFNIEKFNRRRIDLLQNLHKRSY